MHSRIDVTGSIIKIVVIISLFVLLIGCGGYTDNKPSVKLSPTLAPTSTQGVALSMISSNRRALAGFDVAGLHIQTSSIECSFSDFAQQHTDLTRGNLVLTKDPSTYDSGDLEQIRNYIDAFYPAVSPPTLSWTQGGKTCNDDFQITNISKTTLQLLNLDMRLMTTPQQNTMQYHLIDVCPFEKPDSTLFCIGTAGAGQSEHYDFQFKNAPTGTVFHPQTSFIETLLKPTDTLYIDLGFTSTGTPDNLIYQVKPELIFANSSPIELRTEQLFFVDKSQISCSTLQGNSLVSVTPTEYGPTVGPNDQIKVIGRWCL